MTTDQFEFEDTQMEQLQIPFYSGKDDSNDSLTYLELSEVLLKDHNDMYSWPSTNTDIPSDTELSHLLNLPMHTFDVSDFIDTEQNFTLNTSILSPEYLKTRKTSTDIITDFSEQFYKPQSEPDDTCDPLNDHISQPSANLCLEQEFQTPDKQNCCENGLLPKNEIVGTNVLLKSNAEQSSNKIEDFCLRLIPLINNVTPQNYGEFLVGVLREILHDTPLEGFYNLLYNSSSYPSNFKQGQGFAAELGLEGLKICSFIIETFGLPKRGTYSVAWESIKYALICSVKFEEFIRAFLAIKILFEYIEEADVLEPCHTPILRSSVYDAYSEVCKNLNMCYRRDRKSSSLHRRIVLGKAQFARITKMVYPNLKLRRLGRRGNSRPQYLGVAWKKCIDTEINRNVRLRTDDKKNGKFQIPANCKPEAAPKTKMPFLNPCVGLTNSSYSFFNASKKFSYLECLPRALDYVIGKLPKQSRWSIKTVSRSATFLKKYNVDMWPVIQNIHQNIIAPHGLSFFVSEFVQRMNTLINGNSGEEAYMHFYLTYLLLIFPIILSSNEEVRLEDKVQLRENLMLFINLVKSEVIDLPNHEYNHLINFLNIIRKMIHINEMSLSYVRTGLAKSVTQEIGLCFQGPAPTQLDLFEKTVIEESVFRAVLMASNAFQYAFIHPQKGQPENTHFITQVVKAFVNFSTMTTRGILEIPNSMSLQDLELPTFDLPFQLFKILSRYFHQVFLFDPSIQKLPIHVINYILLEIHKETNNASFSAFGKRDRELSKDTFKTLWIHTSLAEEYVQILAEIVSLSETLRQL